MIVCFNKVHLLSLQTVCKSNRKICKYYKKNLLSLFQQMTSVDSTVFFSACKCPSNRYILVTVIGTQIILNFIGLSLILTIFYNPYYYVVLSIVVKYFNWNCFSVRCQISKVKWRSLHWEKRFDWIKENNLFERLSLI